MVDRTSPMRRVVGRCVDSSNRPWDSLECGHRKLMAAHLVDGVLHYESLPRRRCQKCAAQLAALASPAAAPAPGV